MSKAMIKKGKNQKRNFIMVLGLCVLFQMRLFIVLDGQKIVDNNSVGQLRWAKSSTLDYSGDCNITLLV